MRVEQLFLVRHAETDWNAERRLQGHADRPLSARGREQASMLGAHLQGTSFDAIFTSDLRRARETAALAGLERECARAFWREFDVGHWSGQLIGDIIAQEGDAYARWRSGNFAPPGGESWTTFEKRIRGGLSLLETLPGRVLLVTHSGVIRAILKILLGLPPEQLAAVGHGSVTVIKMERSPEIMQYDYRPGMEHGPAAD
jgi:probable phosphoglycerate mutase